MDREKTELFEVVYQNDAETCKEACRLNEDCTAVSFEAESLSCSVFTETQTLKGDVYSSGVECFFKIENVKELYSREPGYCKLAPDATLSTLKFTGIEDIETVKDCKVACDEALIKCWGF